MSFYATISVISSHDLRHFILAFIIVKIMGYGIINDYYMKIVHSLRLCLFSTP